MPSPAAADTTDRLVRELDDGWSWVAAARELTGNLGFRLLEPDPSGRRGPATEGHLLVALREPPTLRHFDPEAISYYGPAGDGAGLTTVTRLEAGGSMRRSVLWGHVHVVDRVPVENRFLTFGGTLEMVGLDRSLTLAHLRSPAPIVRWGGHSQGIDALTLAIGAFFGRLIVPVDFQPGAAARIDAAPPTVLFAAFLADATARAASADRAPREPADLDRWLAAAWARVRSDPEVCGAAIRLLESIGLRGDAGRLPAGPSAT